MKLRFLIILLYLFVALDTSAQETTISWLSFDELNIHFKEEQKPILIFIHADWCKFCKMQENNTFKDSLIIAKLNQGYYTIKLNAESKKTVRFFGREYSYDQEGGFHQLATYLGNSNGKLELPTTVLLNERLEPIYRKSALVSQEEMKVILK